MSIEGVEFDALNREQVTAFVCHALARRRGGRIVTPNVDILRQAWHCREARAHIAAADLVVADGAPLVWASRLSGRPLPERVAGSDLVWTLAADAAAHGRSLYLLGGAPGREPGTALRAAQRLRHEFPNLLVTGTCCPPAGFDDDPAWMSFLARDLMARAPDMVYVGLGFPKQERFIARIAPLLPNAWFLGCGAGIDFLAGERKRAPGWMRRGGLEWVHRLGSEPRRLFGRYVVHDIPAACRLLWRSRRPRGRHGRARTADRPGGRTTVGANGCARPYADAYALTRLNARHDSRTD